MTKISPTRRGTAWTLVQQKPTSVVTVATRGGTRPGRTTARPSGARVAASIQSPWSGWLRKARLLTRSQAASSRPGGERPQCDAVRHDGRIDRQGDAHLVLTARPGGIRAPRAIGARGDRSREATRSSARGSRRGLPGWWRRPASRPRPPRAATASWRCGRSKESDGNVTAATRASGATAIRQRSGSSRSARQAPSGNPSCPEPARTDASSAASASTVSVVIEDAGGGRHSGETLLCAHGATPRSEGTRGRGPGATGVGVPGDRRRAVRPAPRVTVPAARRDHPVRAVHRRDGQLGDAGPLRALPDAGRARRRRTPPWSRRSSTPPGSSGRRPRA